MARLKRPEELAETAQPDDFYWIFSGRRMASMGGEGEGAFVSRCRNVRPQPGKHCSPRASGESFAVADHELFDTAGGEPEQ
jgi:hypothetical protein